jgi:DNA polymerase III subunit alpha
MTIKIDFVQCHCHSCNSKRDALSKVDKLVQKAVENGQKAVALTDHGVLHGIPQLFEEAKKAGIKPIAGFEGYLSEGDRGKPNGHFHQLLLAQNETGWKNILKLSSEGFVSGFHGKPRFDMELLRKHSEGIIATSSCLAGWIPQFILEGKYQHAREKAKEFVSIFGDRFYLEIQPTPTPSQIMVNKELIKIAQELNIPLLATGDVHYVEPEDMVAHQAMLCLGRGKKMLNEDTPEYDGEEHYWLKDAKTVFMDFYKTGIAKEVIIEAMNNSGKIADSISFELQKEKDHLPAFPLAQGQDKDKLLGEMVKEGLMRKVPIKTKQYIERIQFELGVIREKGYQDYFLIKSDAIKFAKSRHIEVGKGRGSGAGSLVAYLMDITEVDPIEHGLFFERFLDITRSKMPDIDTDIEDERRYEVLNYLKEKYGFDRVAQVCNIVRMSPKSAFKNALMVYDIPMKTSKEVSKAIPDVLGLSIEEAYKMSPQLVAFRKQQITRNDGKVISMELVFDLAERLEGVIQSLSTHAGGILITPTALSDNFPVFTPEGDRDSLTVQWNKDDVEKYGGVKFDFLGLKMLRTVALTIRSIEKEHGIKIDTNELVRNMNDANVYAKIARGETQNTFQFNSDGMQQLCKAVKPTEFKHIVAINALYRPPALASGDTWRYARIKNGQEEEYYTHPDEREILGETYGIITYQEHVMQLVHKFAGWDYGRGDKLRKMNTEQLEALRDEFCKDADKRGYHLIEQMDEIWSKIVRYMGYGFNKSHGVAYSMLSYITAYLECYYPEHYQSAIMSTKMGDQDKINQVFQDVKKAGFEFQAPDVNLSDHFFTAHSGKIIFPLGMIKGVGDTAVNELLAHKPFNSIADLMERVNKRVVSARAMKPLILAGAFDSLYPELTRPEILGQYYIIKGEKKKAQEVLTELTPWSDELQADYEKDLTGIYISSHPLQKYHQRNWNEYTDGQRGCYLGGVVTKVKAFNDKNGNRMAFVTAETLEGVRKVTVFHNTFKKYEPMIKEKTPMLFVGKKDGEGLLADSMRELL